MDDPVIAALLRRIEEVPMPRVVHVTCTQVDPFMVAINGQGSVPAHVLVGTTFALGDTGYAIWAPPLPAMCFGTFMAGDHPSGGLISNGATQTGAFSNAGGSSSSSATGDYSLAVGDDARAEGEGSVAFNAARAAGVDSLAEGSAYAQGDNSHAEGNSGTSPSAQYAHAEGGGFATGANSHAEGDGTEADGEAAHAEGSSTSASGDHSHAEGTGSQATAAAAHAEGDGTTASNHGAHAEGGGGTVASGQYSHAEGDSTTASGDFSHSEGQSAQATNFRAHAEGSNTTASGQQSHAEGDSSIASGDSSHAEGISTTASGQAAHAEGSATIASGAQSHAEGEGTHAFRCDESSTASQFSKTLQHTRAAIAANNGTSDLNIGTTTDPIVIPVHDGNFDAKLTIFSDTMADRWDITFRGSNSATNFAGRASGTVTIAASTGGGTAPTYGSSTVTWTVTGDSAGNVLITPSASISNRYAHVELFELHANT